MFEEAPQPFSHTGQRVEATTMYRHRFLEQLEPQRLPRPQARPINAAAFCVCPMALVTGVPAVALSWRQQVYQLAFEQAQAVVRPSLPERDLLGVWN